jgi:hypothetical protein
MEGIRESLVVRRDVRRSGILSLLLAAAIFQLSAPVFAEQVGTGQDPANHHGMTHHLGTSVKVWEGSEEGKAYSEFNHHLAGVFILLIGLSEFHKALGMTQLAWVRFLLPMSMLGTGLYLMIWSDHDAWPIGSLNFAETFFSGDWELLQHKLYGLLFLAVGSIEFQNRTSRLSHPFWRASLPISAIVGGLMLFLHMHGPHPAAHKIALNHAVMGAMAITAGSFKLLPGPHLVTARSNWGVAWASLILLIGVQLLAYTE